MKVAVTGAGGFVGGNLCRELLARGHTVRALVHERRQALERVAVEIVDGELADPAALARLIAGVDVVVHLAAKISLAPWAEAVLRATNIDGTRAVVEATATAGARLIHVSSIHAFDHAPANAVIDESRGPAAESQPFYDRSKALGEAEVVTARTRGLRAVILNPTAQIGPNDFLPSSMGQLFLDLYTRRLPAVVAGGFNWVDVRDVCATIGALVEREPPSDRYILAGHHRSLAELAALVEEVTKVGAPRFVTPAWLAKGVAPFAELAGRVRRREPALSRAAVDVLQNHQQVSYARVARELDYRPRPLRETITDLYADFRRRGLIA